MNNYEIAKNKVEKEFAGYDHASIAQKWNLKIDENFICIKFFVCDYKIDRKSGKVYAQDGLALREAGFDETFSLFDLLTFAKEKPFPAGKYCRMSSLHGISKYNTPMDERVYNRIIDRVADNPSALDEVCKSLGGEAFGKGDISYRIPLLENLKFCISYWYADDEFPAQMYFMYDENMMKYFKFETIWYIADIILDEIESRLNMRDEPCIRKY